MVDGYSIMVHGYSIMVDGRSLMVEVAHDKNLTQVRKTSKKTYFTV